MSTLFPGFVPITAMFYAVFHPTEGTKVVHQVPSGSMVPTDAQDSSSADEPLFHFDSIKNFIIPKPQLCDRLISFKVDQFRVVGFPVNIYGSHYARNSFSFNFCFVFPYDRDITPYKGNIKRLGKMFRALEEQSRILSKKSGENSGEIFFKDKESSDYLQQQHSNPLFQVNQGITEDTKYLRTVNPNVELQDIRVGGHKLSLNSIESLIQQIYQDLNNYSECLIPIDASNSVDIKLFPVLPSPADILPSDVPVPTMKLDSMVDLNWDPTMIKILPFINGINPVCRISQLADADYYLTKTCIQHLLYYQCLNMVSIFQFSNTYAPTPNVRLFLTHPTMAAECQEYVLSEDVSFSELPMHTPSPLRNEEEDYFHRPSSHSQSASAASEKQVRIVVPSQSSLFTLYSSLHQGHTIKEWYIHHQRHLRNIDLRRFLLFGVLKGIIYHVRAIPVLHTSHLALGSSAIDEDPAQENLVAEEPTSSSQPAFKGLRSYQLNEDISESVLTVNSGKVRFRGSAGQADLFQEKPNFKKISQKSRQKQQLFRHMQKSRDFDYICTELASSRSEVESLLDEYFGSEWGLLLC